MCVLGRDTSSTLLVMDDRIAGRYAFEAESGVIYNMNQ